ncbi:GGDEF domain-containing protein [bacterium]|nr:GGDEF domain-containing protein [bacterium]
MKLFTSRWRLLLIIGVILVSGFVVVNLAHYYVSSNSVRSALINNELPLTSNNIYSEIQASLLRPIYISSLMANDTFLKDWVLDNEEDTGKITKYLAEIRNRYAVSSTFLVSAKTLRYYHFDGILKHVSKNVPKDSWFFSMHSHPENYRVEVDTNEANRNHLTIFINHKLFDYDNNFIGVTGLGLDIASVAKMIERYQHDYRRNVYFIDRKGQIKSHTEESMIDKISIQNMTGIKTIAVELLSGQSGFLSYKKGHDDILLSYRLIPELNWFLLVEQTESEALKPIRQALYLNLMISAGITLLVLLISGFTVNRYHSQLEKLAKTDKLTGLINRQYFDVLFDHALDNVGRHTTGLSLAMFDMDNFKKINDSKGHLAGDRLLQSVSVLVQEHIRKSDIIARWGGDEFVILLQKCDAETATRLMDKIRERIVSTLNEKATDISASISVGIAEYEPGDTCDTLLARTDKHLYLAKENGRNCVVSKAS